MEYVCHTMYVSAVDVDSLSRAKSGLTKYGIHVGALHDGWKIVTQDFSHWLPLLHGDGRECPLGHTKLHLCSVGDHHTPYRVQQSGAPTCVHKSYIECGHETLDYCVDAANRLLHPSIVHTDYSVIKGLLR